MCIIESCVGVGEIAVSDHRSSCPTPHELARIARLAVRCTAIPDAYICTCGHPLLMASAISLGD